MTSDEALNVDGGLDDMCARQFALVQGVVVLDCVVWGGSAPSRCPVSVMQLWNAGIWESLQTAPCVESFGGAACVFAKEQRIAPKSVKWRPM